MLVWYGGDRAGWVSIVTNYTNAASNLLHKALFGTMLELSAAREGDQLAAPILVSVLGIL